MTARRLNEATARSLTAAREMGGEVTVLCAGSGCEGVAREAAALEGVSKVLCADSDALANAMAEPLADLIVSLSGDYGHLVAPATANGKNVMARVAGLLDAMILSDITRVVSPDTFERPIYAGNAIQDRSLLRGHEGGPPSGRRPSMRPEAAARRRSSGSTSDREAACRAMSGEESQSSDRPELTSARVVISGGRGMGAGENFALLDPIADRLKAAVGASRAAVDAGYAPNDMQVGQTGKVVAPDLYIAVGISGAIQHLAGMKDSKVIVAINKDPEAPIFQVSDYGLVADLFDAVPELAGALERLPA